MNRAQRARETSVLRGGLVPNLRHDFTGFGGETSDWECKS